MYFYKQTIYQVIGIKCHYFITRLAKNINGEIIKNKTDKYIKKEKFNSNDDNEYYDYIQMGPMEEEILYEFHFEVDKFKEYLKKHKSK